MSDFNPIFLDLTTRWLSAARPADHEGDAAVAIHFPARLVAGPVGEVETRALLYGHRPPALFAVGGGIVRVGGPPVAAGPFVPRSGSVLPTGGGRDDEDALLAAAAIAGLGGGALTHDLVVMTTDGNDASRLAEAFSRLAGQVQPLDDDRALAMPRTVSVLSAEAVEGIRLAAVQQKWITNKTDSRQALIYAAGRESCIWATTEADIEPMPLADSGLYARWEAHFLGSNQDAVVGPSEALQHQYKRHGEFALARNSSGEIVNFSAYKATSFVEKPTIEMWIEELGDTFTKVRALYTDATVVGPDTPLYTTCLKDRDFNAVPQTDFVNGFSIYACRAYCAAQDMRFSYTSVPSPSIGAPSYLHRRRRRIPPVSFREATQEFILRLPATFVDPDLAITLRAFAQSTRPSRDSLTLLSRLIRIERK
ncbi:hypothetical protein V5F40_21620 [Xanthobacter sp. DSM 14520]|uniref:hypothetical protein n=1 Tax=Xanthobacter autotrophicus (strain ATCC BAA-1158 / Py2) TaxID=78245 RepID=UPI0037285E03